jgi:hypothetical protein
MWLSILAGVAVGSIAHLVREPRSVPDEPAAGPPAAFAELRIECFLAGLGFGLLSALQWAWPAALLAMGPAALAAFTTFTTGAGPQDVMTSSARRSAFWLARGALGTLAVVAGWLVGTLA